MKDEGKGFLGLNPYKDFVESLSPRDLLILEGILLEIQSRVRNEEFLKDVLIRVTPATKLIFERLLKEIFHGEYLTWRNNLIISIGPSQKKKTFEILQNLYTVASDTSERINVKPRERQKAKEVVDAWAEVNGSSNIPLELGWFNRAKGQYIFSSKLFEVRKGIRQKVFQELMDLIEKYGFASISTIRETVGLKTNKRARQDILIINNRLKKKTGYFFSSTGKGAYKLNTPLK